MGTTQSTWLELHKPKYVHESPGNFIKIHTDSDSAGLGSELLGEANTVGLQARLWGARLWSIPGHIPLCRLSTRSYQTAQGPGEHLQTGMPFISHWTTKPRALLSWVLRDWEGSQGETLSLRLGSAGRWGWASPLACSFVNWDQQHPPCPALTTARRVKSDNRWDHRGAEGHD